MPYEKLRSKSSEITQRYLQPITDDIVSYINGKLHLWKTQSNACIQNEIKDLGEELNDLCDSFEVQLNTAIDAFHYQSDSPKKPAKATIQQMIALANLDPSTVTSVGTDDNGIPWSQLVARTGSQLIINAALDAVFASGPAFRIAGVATALIIAVRANKTARQKAYQMGSGAIEALKKQINEMELTFKKTMIDQIDDMKNKATETTREVLAARQAEIDRLANEQQRSEAEQEAKKKELAGIADRMRKRIEELYALTYGKKPSDKEFEAFGASGTAVF